jgi:acetoin utilization deacetylase AcuC-like enzyme
MAVLLGTHPRYLEHDTGSGHPERSERLVVVNAILAEHLGDDLVRFVPRPATDDELSLVHSTRYLSALERACAVPSWLDQDTHVGGPTSFEAARLAAGAGPDAVERLRRGEADAAFLALRPPGHHALGARAMGFCLVNNIAVTAATLVAAGERVAIVDFDAHHGNGTQDAFFQSAEVLYCSVHEWPFYPGSGRASEVGEGPGRGTTLNVPVPPGTTGDVLLQAVEELIVPAVEAHRPGWLLLSAGFDGHRDDPLCDLSWSAGDFALVVERLVATVPKGRVIAFLEGGYDLDALARSALATVSVLAGQPEVLEAATGGARGRDALERAAGERHRALEAARQG